MKTIEFFRVVPWGKWWLVIRCRSWHLLIFSWVWRIQHDVIIAILQSIHILCPKVGRIYKRIPRWLEQENEDNVAWTRNCCGWPSSPRQHLDLFSHLCFSFSVKFSLQKLSNSMLLFNRQRWVNIFFKLIM